MAKSCASFEGDISGKLYLSQASENEPTIIQGILTGKGLIVGQKHAISIHCYGDIDQIGPVYNPFRKPHGAPDDDERKVGNLGNVSVFNDENEKPKCKVYLIDRHVKLIGPFSVIGRSIAIFSNEDDFGRSGENLSLHDGNVGTCVSIGIIGISQ